MCQCGRIPQPIDFIEILSEAMQRCAFHETLSRQLLRLNETDRIEFPIGAFPFTGNFQTWPSLEAGSLTAL